MEIKKLHVVPPETARTKSSPLTHVAKREFLRNWWSKKTCINVPLCLEIWSRLHAGALSDAQKSESILGAQHRPSTMNPPRLPTLHTWPVLNYLSRYISRFVNGIFRCVEQRRRFWCRIWLAGTNTWLAGWLRASLTNSVRHLWRQPSGPRTEPRDSYTRRK